MPARNERIRFWAIVMSLGLLLCTAEKAAASAFCSVEGTVPAFIWLSRTLTSGTQYTIETANITGDPVLHVFKSNPSGTFDNQWVQVAANDDFSGNSSRVVYTPSTSGEYKILVRAFSSTTGGFADLKINGSTILTHNAYGSNVTSTTFSTGETVRVTSTRRNTGNQDPLLFLLSATTTVERMNDDTGPNFYPVVNINVNSTSSSRIVWGHYPTGLTSYGRMTIEPTGSGATDSDGDGVANSLETACGLNPNKIDSDADAIPDQIELFGNNGFSYSLGNTFTNNPTRRNVYVEVDYMNNANVKVPYSSMRSDAETIYKTDGTVDLYVEPLSSITYTANITLDSSCGTVMNCTTIAAVKSANFSVNLFERQLYFHYAVFGDRLVRGGALACNGGVAGVLAQDLLVTLGTGCFGTPPDNTQRGAFVHELGHNVNLVHNRNDAATNNFSQVHRSIMNYRYTYPGISGKTGLAAYTYSFGTGGCADCNTSPKQVCIDARNGPFGNSCMLATNCDCDVNEWGQWFLADFVNGTPNPNPGPSGGPASQPMAAAALLPELTPVQFAGMKAAMNRNVFGGKETPVKTTEPDKWIGDAPDLGKSRRPELVSKHVESLKARGLEQGKDFHLLSDGLTIVQDCL